MRPFVLVVRCERSFGTESDCGQVFASRNAIACSSQPVRTSVRNSAGSERAFGKGQCVLVFGSGGANARSARVGIHARETTKGRVVRFELGRGIGCRKGNESCTGGLDNGCTICYDHRRRPGGPAG